VELTMPLWTWFCRVAVVGGVLALAVMAGNAV